METHTKPTRPCPSCGQPRAVTRTGTTLPYCRTCWNLRSRVYYLTHAPAILAKRKASTKKA